jgi:hypothetical protein
MARNRKLRTLTVNHAAAVPGHTEKKAFKTSSPTPNLRQRDNGKYSQKETHVSQNPNHLRPCQDYLTDAQDLVHDKVRMHNGTEKPYSIQTNRF